MRWPLVFTRPLEEAIVIGTRYRVGDAELLAAQPRLPCFKLGIRLRDANFPRQFLDSGRLGTYFRVEEPGNIAAGDHFEVLTEPDHGLTVDTLWRTVFRQRDDRDTAERALASLPHLDAGWQKRLRALL